MPSIVPRPPGKAKLCASAYPELALWGWFSATRAYNEPVRLPIHNGPTVPAPRLSTSNAPDSVCDGDTPDRKPRTSTDFGSDAVAIAVPCSDMLPNAVAANGIASAGPCTSTTAEMACGCAWIEALPRTASC